VPCAGFVGDEFPFIILPLKRDTNVERHTLTKSRVASYVILTSSCTTDRITAPIMTYENPVCVNTIPSSIYLYSWIEHGYGIHVTLHAENLVFVF